MVSGTEVNIFDVLEHLVTIITIVGFALGWYITRKQRQQAGQRAVDQINTLATNHFPHMEQELQDQTTKMDRHESLLNRQTELLISMDKNLGILVDRTPRI